MKPRWLLLAVSVICLMALFPAAALSQAARIEAGCGSATIDGRVGAAEWENAAQLPLVEYLSVSAAQGPLRVEEVTPSQEQLGTAYFMNDEQYLYVGATLPDPEDQVPDNAAYYDMFMVFAFEDEPPGNRAAWVDCAWRAQSCNAPDDEGWLFGGEWERPNNDSGQFLGFTPWAAPHEMCAGGMPVAGSIFDAAPRADAAHFEMRVDLESSQLNNPDPAIGDCFGLRWILASHYGQDAAGASGYVDAGWPADPVDDDPYTGDCSVLCLNPCEEEFVPEPATLMLLGGGLLSLAGYAGLRWRARE